MNALYLSLLLLHAGGQQPACPNLSGDYVIQGQDGRVRVSIQQTACKKIAVSWVSTLPGNNAGAAHHLSLDGVFHSDSGWFNGSEGQSTAAVFQKNVLEISERPRGATAADPIEWTLRIEKLPNADICTRFVQGSIKITSLAAKRRGTTVAAENDAARRSENDCRISSVPR